MNIFDSKITAEFSSRFGTNGIIVKAPGRVNLIGEHTDYNQGFVLPGSIGKYITVEIKPNSIDNCRIYSLDYKTEFHFRPNENISKNFPHWAKYIAGVVIELIKDGYHVKPFDAVFSGDIPLGAGLSSSAALESAFALALNHIYDFRIDRSNLALIGQRAENNHAGVQCGIMDQFASLLGEEKTLLKLDCRSLEFERIPFHPENTIIVLADTLVKHNLASSEYNIRRQQCNAGVEAIQKIQKNINSLRDVSPDMLLEIKSKVESNVFNRCKYVVEEIIRTNQACDALKADDYDSFGIKMFETHHGLSKLYEVSCKELDLLVNAAKTANGVYGARMMGGGFGGCTINLILKDRVEDFTERVGEMFKCKFHYLPKFYKVEISKGAHIEE
ncbi:MAG: galactokinase [Bacteroidales bacterium]|nr:MAG: galactokinase [Bacteroidales bacterium]